MTRDPRIDPKPGDLVEKGVVRRVTEATEKVVGWVVVGLANGAGSCSLAHWRRWAEDALVHRDTKPSNVMVDAPKLSERDAAALRAIGDDAGDGWTQAPTRALELAAELGHGTWQRAVASLVAARLVDRQQTGRRSSDQYRLTAAGRAAHRGPLSSPVGHSSGPPGPLSSEDDEVSFSPMSFKDQKKGTKDRSSSTAEGGPVEWPTASAVGHSEVAARMADSPLLIEVIRQQRLVLAMLEGALAGRPSSAVLNEHGDGPCDECGAPTKRCRNGADDRAFLGCSRYPACQRTRSIRSEASPPKRRKSPHDWGKDGEAALERARRGSTEPTRVTDAIDSANALLRGRA